MSGRKETISIRPHLLWEYNWETINFSAIVRVVVERVIERGTPAEWQEIVNFYGCKKILAVAEESSRLDIKHSCMKTIRGGAGQICKSEVMTPITISHCANKLKRFYSLR